MALGCTNGYPCLPQEASLRFALPGSGTEGPAKQENFILGSCG
jgi:hypothetical protein